VDISPPGFGFKKEGSISFPLFLFILFQIVIIIFSGLPEILSEVEKSYCLILDIPYCFIQALL